MKKNFQKICPSIIVIAISNDPPSTEMLNILGEVIYLPRLATDSKKATQDSVDSPAHQNYISSNENETAHDMTSKGDHRGKKRTSPSQATLTEEVSVKPMPDSEKGMTRSKRSRK
jgi:hypothetical protein